MKRRNTFIMVFSVFVLAALTLFGCADEGKINGETDSTKKNPNDIYDESADSNEKTITRVNEIGLDDSNGEYLLFGSYPQTEVMDKTLTAELTSLAGTLPTEENSQAWTSYGYYIGGVSSEFMWYIDLAHNGAKYRGVYFTSYRPYYCTESASHEYFYQDNNGYVTLAVYWFEYEPVKWRILTETDGKALILADLALDSQQFYHDDYGGTQTRNDKKVCANNYAESDIRTWLNDTFYDTAFNALQKELIETTNVDNGVSGTGYDGNPYVCENTDDKVFLLSFQEATEYLTAAERKMKVSDYAKSQGIFAHEGACWWWLRSPSKSLGDYARTVSAEGALNSYDGVEYILYGVLPALTVKLN